MAAEMTEHQLEVPRLEAETVRLAQLTVAAHATDAADCVRLFDILGIQPTAPEIPAEPEPEPVEVTNRADPVEYVPVDQLQMVVERIRVAKGWGHREIARRAGVTVSTLVTSCAPSCKKKFVRRSMYTAVLHLAQELSA